ATATGEADAGETATGETVASEADETRGGAGTAAVAPAVASVAAAFDDEGWPHEVRADSDRLELAVALGDREWRAVVEPGDRDGWCTITSIFPDRVPAARRGEVATRLLGVSESLSRGSFSLDEETGRLAFRTPFVPASEPVRDAVGEHVTTVAEWLDELPS
ncbi:MAG: YbjN domain-containing protein, partial [Halobaculum sp.]